MLVHRLKKELHDFESIEDEFSESIFCRPVEGDLMHWEVVILGPKDSLYDGGFFFIDVTFPKDYPFKPPRMRFVTKIWHVNIGSDGTIGNEIFNDSPLDDSYGWSPYFSVRKACIVIKEMLADPNWDNPLVPEVNKRRLFHSDRAVHDAKVREEVSLHGSSWEGAEWTRRNSKVVQVTGTLNEEGGLIVTAISLSGNEVARVSLDQASKSPIVALRAKLADAMSIAGSSIHIVLPTGERLRDIDPTQFHEKLLSCKSEVVVEASSEDKSDESK